MAAIKTNSQKTFDNPTGAAVMQTNVQFNSTATTAEIPVPDFAAITRVEPVLVNATSAVTTSTSLQNLQWLPVFTPTSGTAGTFSTTTGESIPAKNSSGAKVTTIGRGVASGGTVTADQIVSVRIYGRSGN